MKITTPQIIQPDETSNEQWVFTKEDIERSVRARRFIKRYARIMDKFWVDALAWLFGFYTDLALWIVHSAVTLYRAQTVRLPQSTIVMILMRHWVDVILGAIPVLWPFLDFGIRSNMYAQEKFDEHHDFMVQSLIEQWVDVTTKKSWAPSERFQDWSIEGLWKKVEEKLGWRA